MARSSKVWALAAGLLVVFAGTTVLPAGGFDCGCDRPTCVSCNPCAHGKLGKKHCHHHYHHYCEEQPARRRGAEAAPRAAIVDSIPMFQMSAGVVAMPMMMTTGVRAASFVPETRAAEQTCASSGGRLDEIEAQVDALNLRMRTIQRSVEIQTRILEEMKAEGMFPKKLKEKIEE